MKKLVMLLALAVAFSLSGFAQAGGTSSSTSGGATSTDTGKTSTKKSSKKAASSDTASSSEAGAKSGGKSSTVTGCLKSDTTPVTLTNGKYKNGVQVDTSADTTDDWAKHNGHKVQLTGSWDGTGADKKFKATAMKHVAETCTAGGSDKASATGGKKSKGKKDAGADASKTPSK